MSEAKLDHERCSELLRDYVRGDLARAEAEAVEAHLATCDDCTLELRGVRALLDPPDERLSDLERRRLHAAVAAEAGTSRSSSTEVYPARASAARWLGVAALVVLIAVGAASLGSGIFDVSQEAGLESADGGGNDGAARDRVPAAPEAGDTLEDADDSELRAPPTPLFDGDEIVKETTLLQRARRGPPFTAYKAAFGVDDAQALQDDYLELLATQADPREADLIRACAQQVLANESYPLLPAYATIGTREGADVLVLGFAWTGAQSGPLDRFQLWTWPVGQCDAPPEYSAGRIRD